MKKIKRLLFNLATTKEQRDFLFKSVDFSLYTSKRRLSQYGGGKYQQEIDTNTPILESLEPLRPEKEESNDTAAAMFV